MGFDYHYYVGNNDFLKYFHFSAVHGGQGKNIYFPTVFDFGFSTLLYYWIHCLKITINISQSHGQ